MVGSYAQNSEQWGDQENVKGSTMQTVEWSEESNVQNIINSGVARSMLITVHCTVVWPSLCIIK